MADKKISELTAAGALTGTELVEVVQGGVNKQSTTQDIANLGGGGGAVDSVNGQTGVVVLDAGDVGADPAGSASTVATNLSNHISDATDAHDASAISFSATGNIAATDVQAAIQELDGEKIGSSDVVGVKDLFIPASAMWPTITDGCATLAQSEIATSLFNVQTLDFDQTTEEHAQFQLVLPRAWNNLTITFVPYWTASAGTPGQTVRWQMNGGSYANDDSLTTAPGSSIAVDDTLLATNDLHIGAESSPMTFSNTPASMDLLMLQVHRGVASDDLAADAKLLGVSLRITVTAAKDA